MQSRLLLASFLVVVLTVLLGFVPSIEAASTERPYQFGFTIEKQQHRQEKKDERGIVMGEFGFITADGIYHVTVYATDEEGKFRILAMRSYPYEENPKTIEMVVRPKPQPTTPKAIATPATTAKPKPFEKHNFSVQGCSGCFLKNNAPTTTTTTRKPEDKKYDISLLSRPLAPEQAPVIGKQIVANVLPQVIQEVQQVETKLKQTATNVPPKVAVVIDKAIAQQITPPVGKPVAGFSTNANPQKAQGSQTTQKNLPLHSTQTQQKPQFAPPKPLETLSTNANHLSPVVAPILASSAPPSSTLAGSKANTPTTSAFGNSPQAPAKTGTNAFSKPANSQSLGGAKGSPASGIPTPSTQITAPAIGGGKGAANQPSANTGSNSGSGGNNGFVGNNKFGGNSGSGAASGSKAGSAAGFGGGSTGSKAATGGSSGSKATTGGSSGSKSVSGGSTGSKPAFGGGSTGSKTGSAAVGEAGDLYRFKYLLDYNGHRETGSHSGNKEGSFYAIGDDNVERTIEYIANEFGYQPRVRFRKLDAPVQAKENTLKDYEFVWFKKQ